jgi:DNA-binding beta-propeller fold protein YncE
MFKKAAIYVLMAIMAMSVASCATSKGQIDYTLSEGIIWPGPPEKPRIKYLWSLRQISGRDDAGQFVRFLAGDVDYDITDPRNADILIAPQGVFVDPNEVIYIADPGAARVSVIDTKTMESFNIELAGGSFLMSPIGVVVAPDGRIYVSDSEAKMVSIFDEKGKFIKFFDGEFKRPTGLAIDPKAGTIYVADTWEHVIYKYGLDGRRKGAIGAHGEEHGKLNYPTYITVDKDGLLYVSDTLNFRVQIFSPSGQSIKSFGVVGDTFDTFDKLKGISVDTEGHIYVADAAQNMIKIYDKEGRLLLFFGDKGRFYGQFDLPAGIFIDSKNRIFVADSLNMRLQVFQFLGGD